MAEGHCRRSLLSRFVCVCLGYVTQGGAGGALVGCYEPTCQMLLFPHTPFLPHPSSPHIPPFLPTLLPYIPHIQCCPSPPCTIQAGARHPLAARALPLLPPACPPSSPTPHCPSLQRTLLRMPAPSSNRCRPNRRKSRCLPARAARADGRRTGARAARARRALRHGPGWLDRVGNGVVRPNCTRQEKGYLEKVFAEAG